MLTDKSLTSGVPPHLPEYKSQEEVKEQQKQTLGLSRLPSCWVLAIRMQDKGTYTATFVANNANYVHQGGQVVRELTINVVE